jgi:outer membrane protein TolC
MCRKANMPERPVRTRTRTRHEHERAHEHEHVHGARCAAGLITVLLCFPAAAAPEPALPRVTLPEALGRALARNPSAAVARQEILRSEALLRQARAATLPALGATGTYTRLDRERVAATSGLRIADTNQLNGNLVLSVPLVAPGAWAGVNRAADARDLARANEVDVGRQIGAAVARAYLGVMLQHRQVEVAARARDTAGAHHDFARARLAGGIGTSLDATRAEQELKVAEAQLAAARTALARARSALAVVLSADGPVDIVVGDVPLVPAPPDAATAVAEAQKTRADVRAAVARREAAAHARRDVWTLYAPLLAASGQAFAQRGSAFQPDTGWQAQLLLTLPLYEGGARGAVARERDALEAEATVALEAALRQVSVEVRTAFEVMARADEALAASRESARLARRAAELADLAYRAGATTNLEVTDAERRARDAETQVALAEDTARQSRLDLLLATGRFP